MVGPPPAGSDLRCPLAHTQPIQSGDVAVPMAGAQVTDRACVNCTLVTTGFPAPLELAKGELLKERARALDNPV